MKVLYFAEIKEILAKQSEDIDLSYDITVDEFITD
ncbi:MAG: molybdopterin synthase sulfur carrier subunit, partial [Staphylococcus equorum]|nr:molybdopterin synthase sulfur carrier subunit [Staphylococcus equorum]